jgi:peroxiredoxin
MAIRDKHGIYWITALFLAFVLVLGVLHGCKRDEPVAETPVAPNNVTTAPPASATAPADRIQAAANLFREPRASLQNVVKAAQTWYPAFEEWEGRAPADFTLTDIDGKPHKLSDYRGKDVVVVFWATWCGPCKLEVPHLKELRNTYAKDKLAILAISGEQTPIVKAFAQEQGLNYTVLTSAGDLPAPFSQVQAIPSSFFIDPEGKIKLGVIGIVPTGDAKAIVQAQ